MSITTQGKPVSVDKDYGRKAYMDGAEGDFRELIRRIPRRAILDQILSKKSVFDKPYLHDDYPDMEHFQPPWKPPYLWWPELVFPPWKGPVPSGGDVRVGTGCSLGLVHPHQCDDPIKVDPMIMATTPAGQSPSWEVYVNEAPYYNWTFGGVTSLGITIAAPTGGWTPWPETDADTVCVKLIDTAGNMCWTGIGTICPVFAMAQLICFSDCYPTAPEFTFDEDNTPDTIAPGGNIDVYIVGGLAPYTYMVSGLGYTWNDNAAQTLVSSNTDEQLDAVAEGAG